MSEEAATDTAPVTTDTAPEGDATTQTQGTQDSTEGAVKPSEDSGSRKPISDGGDEKTSDFTLPDEYKEKSWASKVKSQDDVYKLIENQEALIGKKVIQPIDYETATPEEIEAHHAKLAPENGAEGYVWAEHSMPELTKPMGDIFAKAGLNAYQQKVISEGFDTAIEQIAGDKVANDTSEEGYLTIMKESFGDDYEASVAVTENALKEFASDDDKKVFDEVDNNTRASVDRTIHKTVTFYEARIKAILDEHGVVESGAQTEGGEGSNATKSAAEQRAEIRAEMRELDGKPNSHEKKAELQKKLNKLM